MAEAKLRFAALIRVSTEKQEQHGESLRTQAGQIGRAIESLGGVLAATYAGQEHATAGWERAQLDQLLADAGSTPKPFDAVMVADTTRWSRDNVKSETGLDRLKENDIRFFTLSREFNLYNPADKFFLALSATIGAFNASTQNEKSILNRIERAKRGYPSAGKLPYGRRFDKKSGTWSLDPEKVEIIRELAQRYVAGESLKVLARERGMNHANLCRTLREKCGSDWGIQFDSDELNIHEWVPITIPPLLAPELLAAVQHQLTAKRTYMHGVPQKHFYQLTGRVFCSHCGYSLIGQTNANGLRYYKHANAPRARQCPLKPKPWIRCERLEAAVVGKLFQTFGNPAAIERAMKEAIPDCDQLIKRRRRLETELEKIARGRDRVLDLVLKESITSEQAEAKLEQVKPREAELRSELGKVLTQLGSAVDTSQFERAALTVFREAGAIVLEDAEGNHYAGGNDVMSYLLMTDDERLKLTEYAFASPCADGSPAGVYLTQTRGGTLKAKSFSFELRGRLVESVSQYASS